MTVDKLQLEESDCLHSCASEINNPITQSYLSLKHSLVITAVDCHYVINTFFFSTEIKFCSQIIDSRFLVRYSEHIHMIQILKLLITSKSNKVRLMLFVFSMYNSELFDYVNVLKTEQSWIFLLGHAIIYRMCYQHFKSYT